MKIGRDPTDFIAEVDDVRLRLEDMEDNVSADLIEDVILRGHQKEATTFFGNKTTVVAPSISSKSNMLP